MASVLREMSMQPDVAELALRIAALPADKRATVLRELASRNIDFASLPLMPMNKGAAVPLSLSQSGLWLTWSLAPQSAAYNMAGVLELSGTLYQDALLGALLDLAERQQLLRTVFRRDEHEQPAQVIVAVDANFVRVEDTSAASQPDNEGQALDLARQAADAPFDIEAAPPVRFVLIKVAEQRHWLVIVLHHIIADGLSQAILLSDIAALYEARLARRSLPPLPVQFADYAVWQREGYAAGQLAAQLDYWKRKFSAPPPPLLLPQAPRVPGISKEAGAKYEFKIGGQLARQLVELAKARDASVFMVMVALLKLILARFSGQSDICIGAPVSSRRHEETQALLGYFINVVALRSEVDLRSDFSALLDGVRANVLEGYSNPDCPLDLVLRELQIERSAGRSSIFRVKCAEQPAATGAAGLRCGGLAARLWEVGSPRVHFDLSFDFQVGAQGIDCSFLYAADCFDESVVERFAGAYLEFARAVIADPHRRLADLELPESGDGLRGSTKEYPPSVLTLWSRSVARAPRLPVLCTEGTRIDYSTLDARSSALARRLGQLGIGTGDRVGLAADRSVEFVLGLLAVMKAGGVYVPLDPRLPTERLSYQLTDSMSRLLLSTTPAEWAGDIPVLELTLDRGLQPDVAVSPRPLPPVHPAQAAYVIYTSGSTGQPKGVVVTHGALANYVQGVLDELALPQSVRSFAMVSTVAADLGHTVLFGALCSGRTLHLIGAEQAFDPDGFAGYMRDHQVEVLKVAPGHLQALLSAGRPEDVLPRHTLILGGEVMQWPLLDRIRELRPGCRVINHYGPTETTVGVLTQDAGSALRSAATLPIGTPLPNTQGYALDVYLNAVPRGVASELYVGGAGLAHGYLQRPGLTSERFVASPFQDGERLYRTGDRVRVLKNGSVEFLGRADDQVKVRGYRVEPQEVVNALKEQPGVHEAAVIARAGAEGHTQLLGYVVAQSETPLDTGRLREKLAARLPEYMVPSAILALAALPLTANGKLDRKALPEPEAPPQDRYEAPQGDVEQTLAAIWTQLLGAERVGRNDNFFELGGDSILTLQVVARARKHGIKLSPRVLMERQNIAAVAALAERSTMQVSADDADSSSAPFELTPIQQWFFDQHFEQPYHWNQSLMLQATEAIDSEVLHRATRRLIEHHGALRLSFRQDNGRWQQYCQVTAPDSCFTILDLSAAQETAAAITAAADRAQRMLTLQQPFRAFWMDLGTERPGRLLLAAHHLVMDSVSWRLLLEDLQSLYAQLRSGGVANLPVESISIQRWTQTLREHARSEELKRELPYWATLVDPTEPDLPSRNPNGSNTCADAASVTLTLDELQTERLLTLAPQAYRTQIDDLLLTALARTLCEWSGRDSVLIELESHGRQQLSADADLSRTVGWFTSLHPVRLTPHSDAARSIKTIKEILREAPNKGLGYGVLRYLTPEGASLGQGAYPQVTFNYLGQFDQTFAEASLWRVAQESAGAMRSPASRRRCWFDIGAHVYRRQLVLSWSYSRALHAEADVQGLLERYRASLQSLIEHCTSGARGATPSDFPLAGLTQTQLDALPMALERVEDLYPMTPMQQGIFFHSLNDRQEGMYVSQLRVDITGLDVSRFKAAWQAVFGRHAILRTGFLNSDTLSLQWVARELAISFDERDIRDQVDPDGALDELAKSQLLRPFDLARPPLMRFALVRAHQSRHCFIWTHHHLLTDGWSTARLIREVLHYYHHRSLPPLPGRYRDYIQWLRGRDAKAAEQYWKARLRRLAEPTRLAGALPKSVDAAGYADFVREFDIPRTQCLVNFAKRERVTLNTLVQGAWALLLSRYTGQSCVVFGATTSGRPAELPGMEQLIGLFINTFPVIAQVRAGQSVGEWLRELQAQNIASREHGHAPLYEIQRWANSGGQSLFDVVLAFQNFPIDEALRNSQIETLRFSSTRLQDQTHYPLLVQIDHTDRISMSLHGRRKFYAEEVVAAIGLHVGRLLEAIAVDAQRRVGEIELLDTAELTTSLQWGTAAQRYSDQAPVHRLIERRVEQCSSRPAVMFGDSQLGYAELNAGANRLAHGLIRRGLRPEARVGLAMPRSPEMVVGLLAVLKAGAAYVPLNPHYPSQRLEYLVQDSGIELLLTHSAVAAGLPSVDGVPALHVDAINLDAESDRNPDVPVHPDTLAYVIYTSGSTGRPKGVMVRHRALTNFILSMQDSPGLDADDVLVAVTSLCFDIAALELYLPLSVGASVVLATEAQAQDGRALAALLHTSEATALQATPASWRLLLAGGWTGPGHKGLKALCGGEALQPDLAGQLRDMRVELWNMYGPTETTIWSSTGRVDTPRPWLGRPIAATDLRVLTVDLQPTVPGMAGELYIGGIGLSRGYLNRAALTSERFVADPFSSDGERLYRTGDLVRWSKEGRLEYLGRIDHQVKIRGYRIELGEIEAQLLSQAVVREAIVVARDGRDGDAGQRLVAYVVPTQAGLSAVDIEKPASHAALVHQWESVFESAYGEETTAPDFRGWKSSYTDRPMPTAEMQEWLQATVACIQALQPQAILEIGCGVGLLVQHLAPAVPVYVAADFSARALRDLRRLIQTQPRLSHVQVCQSQAADFSALPAGRFDTVVLNSVVQYFPSADYLLEVLQGAARIVGPAGVIFLGDVRHLGYLPMFHASVQFAKASPVLSVRQLQARIHRAVAHDKELALEPEFFHAVAPCLQMAGVEILLKRGRADNELTRYRYDVVLRTRAAANADAEPFDWGVGSGVETLARRLITHRPSALKVRNVPDLRLARDLALWRLLQASEDGATVADVRAQLKDAELVGVVPEDLWALGEQHGYDVRIRWSSEAADGFMDVEFIERSRASVDLPAVPVVAEPLPHWRSHASDPLRLLRTQELQKRVRDHLGRTLPDYMVPNAVVVMESLPLNANGKVDRKALPEPEYGDALRYEAPQGALETALAAIWAEVLGVERVGRTDNFFDLGGHSLTAMQVLAKTRQRFCAQLSLRRLFELPSLADYSAAFSIELQQAGAQEDAELGRMAALLEALED